MVDFELYLGDCLEKMPLMAESGIRANLIICDLPYGKANKSKLYDNPLPLDKLWECYNKILTPGGVVILFGMGFYYAQIVMSNLKMFRHDYVWDKVLTSGHLNSGYMPMRKHENIAVFYKLGKSVTYNHQFTKGKPLHSKGLKYLTKELTNNNWGEIEVIPDHRVGSTQKFPTSILTFQKPAASKLVHRSEKPVELLRWLIRTYSNPGDVVLDNCMGSGSCAEAAIIERRNFVGVEIDETQFDKASKRAEQARGLF